MSAARFLLGMFVSMTCNASPFDDWSDPGVELDLPTAIREYALADRLISFSSALPRADGTAKVRVVKGDLTIAGPLLADWGKSHRAAGLIVTGALVVKGPIINANLNGGPFLLVEGTTRAQSVIGAGAEFLFVGDAVVDEIVVGEYNDGILRFLGSLTVPVAVTNDHHFEIGRGLQGRWLDPFNEGHSWSVVLHPALPVERDEEGYETFDVIRQLVPRLLAGQPVLRPDLPAVDDYPELFE